MQNPHHVEYLAVTTHLFFGFRHGKNAFFLHDFLPACFPARQTKLRRTTMIRSAAFCSMPLAVCRKIPARRILRRTTSSLRLRAPAYIFERVFHDARPRTKKTIVRRFTGKQPRSFRPSAATDISALYLLYSYLKDISR